MDMSELHGGETYADDLTWREQEVLILLAEHLSNREIAERLHLAESTVKDYVSKILGKLYVKNRREAVKRAKALGLLEYDRGITPKLKVNLPPERTPFVGRLAELQTINVQLHETRLLTLTGPGGIGKTRLALKAAQAAAGDFEDGVFFVSLAPISSADHLVQTIAEALKFPLVTHEDPLVQLLRYLRRRRVLLVMDNFEHLLEGAGIISEILQAAPDVKILSTSREKLNLLSETVLNIGGMQVPHPEDTLDLSGFDAISLFLQSARKVRPGFDPSADELSQVTDICQIVQGMPLGIELAAAWLHILNVDEIAGELEMGLDILASDMRDAPERHRSIRSVFDHSWALLQPAEQEIFKILSIFRGGFTRHAAKRVSGASLIQLTALVNKSFLSHDPVSGRLEVHELLRQYAQERLEKTPLDCISAQESHAAYYAQFMQERWDLLKGKQQMEALVEIEADIENVRTAWRFYLDKKNAGKIWQFIYALFLICWYRGWNLVGTELFSEAVRALDGEQDDDSQVVKALVGAFQAYFMTWLGLAEHGYEMAKESVQILSNHKQYEALVFAYDSLVLNAYFLGRYTEWIHVINKMIELAYKIGDKWLVVFGLYAASLYEILLEHYDEARKRAETGLTLAEEIGDIFGSAPPLITLGHAAFAQGEFETARGYYQRCLEISQEIGFHYAIQTSTKYLGKVSLAMGNLLDAEEYILQCLVSTREMGFVRDTVNLLYEYARLQTAYGNPEQAAELLPLVIDHPASLERRMLEGRIRDSAEELLVQLEAELSRETYTTALERGQALDLDGVVEEIITTNRRI